MVILHFLKGRILKFIINSANYLFLPVFPNAILSIYPIIYCLLECRSRFRYCR